MKRRGSPVNIKPFVRRTWATKSPSPNNKRGAYRMVPRVRFSKAVIMQKVCPRHTGNAMILLDIGAAPFMLITSISKGVATPVRVKRKKAAHNITIGVWFDSIYSLALTPPNSQMSLRKFHSLTAQIAPSYLSLNTQTWIVETWTPRKLQVLPRQSKHHWLL